jgi:hypothetical protein
MGHHKKKINFASITKPIASVANSTYHTGTSFIRNTANQPENLVKSLSQNSMGLLPILIVGGVVAIVFLSSRK